MLYGGALGAAGVLFGFFFRAQAEGRTIDPHELGMHCAGAAIAGMVMGAVLRALHSFRQRGRLQHYLSWTIAGVIAVLVVILPDLPEDGWSAVLFALWLGSAAGVSLGLAARHLEGHRW